MNKRKNPTTKERKQAKRMVDGDQVDTSTMTPDDVANLVHELEAHQAQLEVQNEELRRIQKELRKSHDRYLDLYDYAPTGYFTIDQRTNLITEVNLTACSLLGIERERLLKTKFTGYIDPEFTDTYYFCRKMALEDLTTEECELKMCRGGGSSFWARLEILVLPGTQQMRVVMLDTTERKRLESELAYLAAFPELDPNPVLEVDEAGKVTYLNPASKTRFPDLVKKNRRHPFLADWKSVVARLRSGKTATLRRDTYVQEHWYEQAVTYLPSTNSYRLYARDITERKQAEEALNRSEEQYRTLYEEAPNAYFSIGIDGIIQRVNARAVELLGYRLEELIGKPVSDLYADTPNGKARAGAVFKNFLAGQETRDEELEMCRADGSSVWVSLTVKPILDNEGKVIASRSVVTDITQRKRVESIKDEFIGLVSHELKTPLTVVTGAVKTAMDERVSAEERHELLEDAAWGAESLDNILNNLLELSRYQADRLRLDKELVSIRAIADKATRAACNQHPRHVFSVDIPRGLRPINVDPVRLERIITNLIDNAAKYSPEGSEVRVFARREKDETVIGVSDQGVGISPEDRKNLFEPFRRLGIAAKTKGIGLGLVVCKRLVEAHGGRIWLESQPGAGTTFFFTLGQEDQAQHS